MQFKLWKGDELMRFRPSILSDQIDFIIEGFNLQQEQVYCDDINPSFIILFKIVDNLFIDNSINN